MKSDKKDIGTRLKREHPDDTSTFTKVFTGNSSSVGMSKVFY